MEQAITEKRSAYLVHLQINTEQSKETYKLKRSIAKNMVRKEHRELWDKFVSEIENDKHVRQVLAYKVMRHLNCESQDTARLNVIKEEQ
jgi:Glu-tRNA(Gln) amidotransferase subunit E-like FAD-binding protein